LLVLDLKLPTVGAHGAEHPLWTNGSLHDERVFWHARVSVAEKGGSG